MLDGKPACRRERIEATLNRLPFVTWDRMASGEMLVVYGWIPRADGRSDFVLVEFDADGDPYSFVTSSALRSLEVHELVFDGQEAAADHNPCERVEDRLPAVENVVRLAPKEDYVFPEAAALEALRASEVDPGT